jgi:hypothetical protein
MKHLHSEFALVLGSRLQSAALILALVAPGYAQADTANRDVSGARTEQHSGYEAEAAAGSRTNPMVVEKGRTDAEPIEEIIVIGRKNSRRPNLGRTSIIHLPTPKQRQLDWQFLPVYEPERQDSQLALVRHDYETRPGQFIQVFRIKFGRK